MAMHAGTTCNFKNHTTSKITLIGGKKIAMKNKRILFNYLILVSSFFIISHQVCMHASHSNLPPQKHVIGLWNHGFFSAFLSVLNHLAWAEKNNHIPIVYWDHRSLYYIHNGFNGSYNVWEYYFEPVSFLPYHLKDTPNNQYALDNQYFHYATTDLAARQHANHLIKKYVKIKPSIQSKIDYFYQKFMANKNIVGMHIRGTDKYIDEQPVPIERVMAAALENADSNTQFFIASDEQRLLEKARELLPNHIVHYYQCNRSHNQQALHYHNPSPAQAGEDILIEVSLLAKCQTLIHTLSNVSTAVLYFNPSITSVLLR